jgi:hypothetical protein
MGLASLAGWRWKMPIEAYGLPLRSTKSSDSCAAKFTAKFGEGSVELDALRPTFCATSRVSPSTGQTIRSPHTRGRTNMVVVVSGSNTVTKAVLPLAATVAPSPRPPG